MDADYIPIYEQPKCLTNKHAISLLQNQLCLKALGQLKMFEMKHIMHYTHVSEKMIIIISYQFLFWLYNEKSDVFHIYICTRTLH